MQTFLAYIKNIAVSKNRHIERGPRIMSRKGENIYKRKDGRWEGRVIKPNGKYRYLYAKTYREVRLKMKDTKEINKANKTERLSSQKNAADLFEKWLSGETINRLKPTTYENYYHCINRYVIPYFKLPGNEQLSEESIKYLVEKISEDTSISVSYRKKILSILKTALREICKDIPNHPVLGELVTLPKVKNGKEILVFSMKEQRIIENTVQRSEDKRLLGILLCFYSGIRLGELCALKWGDFDFEAGSVSIMRTVSRVRNRDPNGEKTFLHVGTPKSETSLRKIPLPVFLLKLIEEYSLPFKENDCYMLSGKADPFDPRIYQRLYKKVLVAAGVKDRKFHTIRHTFATRALELGVDIKTLSEILGHSNVNITLNVYAHSLMEQKKAAIEKFNEMHVTYMNQTAFAVNSAVIATHAAG